MRPTVRPSVGGVRPRHGAAALCTCVAVVSVALLVMVLRSGWAPWIVGAAAIALMSMLLAIAGLVIAVTVALSHRDGRDWLVDRAARLAQARAVREQHLHLPSGHHTFHD